MNPWEKSYETRSWKTYKIPLSSGEEPMCESVSETEFSICGSDSEVAAVLKDSPRRFYFDWEQVAAGMDKVYGLGFLGRLTAPWRGHSAGTLVMMLYAGVEEDPRCFTYAVEVS